MSETAFARTYVALLDTKPTKLSADHVEDPRSYPPHGAYILPKMTKALIKPAGTSAPGSEHRLTVLLKSLRNPPLDITLSDQLPNTSILDLKNAITEREGIAAERIKILWKKRPVGDSKVLREVVGEETLGKVEFGVMVIGGEKEKVVATPAEDPEREKGMDVLNGNEFWSDLKGYLMQRVRDEGVGTEVFEVFKKAWADSKS